MKGDVKFLEEVVSVYHGINLLTIKKTYRILSDMDPKVIESFVQKYSDFVIFLLNILDEGRSGNLLDLLTDSSLVYLAEEELRSLLIQVVGRRATTGEDFLDISLFMDSIDRPQEQSLGHVNDVQINILNNLKSFREQIQGSQFQYLERINSARKTRIRKLLIERNMSVVIGLMLYCSNDLLVGLMRSLVEIKSPVLKKLPFEMYEVALKQDTALYADPGLVDLLPEKTLHIIKQVQSFQKREATGLKEMREVARNQELSPAKLKKKRLELLSILVRKIEMQDLEIALADLIREGLIEAEDLEMIRSLQS